MGKTVIVTNENGDRKSTYGIKQGRQGDPYNVCMFEPLVEPPSRVDLRPYCSGIEDQSQSNSCCANAVVGAYEYLCKRDAMASNEVPGEVSRLFVYYVGRLRDKQLFQEMTPLADEGMTLVGAIDAMAIKGACVQATWPFDLTKVNPRFITLFSY
jgi:hypothetical protein